jgi:hypothetical protein
MYYAKSGLGYNPAVLSDFALPDRGTWLLPVQTTTSIVMLVEYTDNNDIMFSLRKKMICRSKGIALIYSPSPDRGAPMVLLFNFLKISDMYENIFRPALHLNGGTRNT